jgi:hypothetical protein
MHIDFHFFHDERMAWKYCSAVTITSVIKFSSQSRMLWLRQIAVT